MRGTDFYGSLALLPATKAYCLRPLYTPRRFGHQSLAQQLHDREAPIQCTPAKAMNRKVFLRKHFLITLPSEGITYKVQLET
jgi:hypothetical protein